MKSKPARHVFSDPHKNIPLPPVKALAIATIRQAVRELLSKDVIAALDAALWLASDDFPLWADVSGLPAVDGVQFMCSGTARKARELFRDRERSR